MKIISQILACRMFFIPIAGIIFFFLSYTLLSNHNLSKYKTLAEKGRLAEVAIVISKEPNNHQFVKYSYQIDGYKFEGSGSGGNGNPEFAELEVGEKVIVFYDPDSPENSVLGNPDVQYKNEKNLVYYGSLIIATFVCFLLFLNFRSNRKGFRSHLAGKIGQNENKKLTHISWVVGGSFIVIWGSFWVYCFQTAPRFPIVGTGRIYSVNFHGTFIYLTKTEYFTLYAIPICFLLFGIISAILMRYKIVKL